ncbi:MAG: CopG family antitoxin [Bdellovibrio sp.]|jgi:predicted DNA binding CopG/RHH family protein
MKKKTNAKLSAEERRLEAEIERGEWTPVSGTKLRKLESEMVDAARAQSKEARVNLRLNHDDVEKIRQKAQQEGIPYQTLIGSVLHKYATDQLLDEKAVEMVVRKLGKKAVG